MTPDGQWGMGGTAPEILFRYRAERLTPYVNRALQASVRWRVLHRFERVCNLVDERGSVIAIHLRQSELAPFGLSVSAVAGGEDPTPFPRWLAPEAPVALEAQTVRLGPAQIDLLAAQIWDPRPDWSLLRARSLEIAGRLPELFEDLAAAAPPGSLLEALSPAAANYRIDLRAPGTSPLSRSMLEAARGHIQELLLGLWEHDLERLSGAVSGLAGLGGGLTPAGDDFLAGAILGAWATCPAGRARLIGETIAGLAASRTTRFSGAWLRAAARGEAAAPWHPFLQALNSSDRAGLSPDIVRLAQVGHTSGADSLAGFLAVLDMQISLP